jgi:hypothetical protein
VKLAISFVEEPHFEIPKNNGGDLLLLTDGVIS